MYEFENKVFRQQAYWVNDLIVDLKNKEIIIELIANPDTLEIDGIISFKGAIDIHKNIFNTSEEKGYIESLLGIEDYIDKQGIKYIITTDVMEVLFITNKEPLVKWVDPTKPKQKWHREIIKI